MKAISANAEVVAVVLSVCAGDKGKLIHCYVIKGDLADYSIVKNSLISVYGKEGDLDSAQILFSEMKRKNIVSWNSLISRYANSGFCDEALGIFSQLEKKLDESSTVRPNVVSWSAMIGGFASNGRAEVSLHLFRKMKLSNVMVNSVTICSVLSACAELSALVIGREIHGHVVRSLIDSNILDGNGLINMYTKCRSIKEGYSIFEKLNGKDLISWNSMIAGYEMNGFGEMALKLFTQMVGSSIKPDKVTFVAILSACSHAGLVSEGLQIFYQMMNKFKIEPLLGLNVLNLNSDSCGSHMLLSNVYAASGRYEEYARVRNSAKLKGLKKMPSQSWIEINKFYILSAGKAMHMGLKEIYKVMQILVYGMEIKGLYTRCKLCITICQYLIKFWFMEWRLRVVNPIQGLHYNIYKSKEPDS